MEGRRFERSSRKGTFRWSWSQIDGVFPGAVLHQRLGKDLDRIVATPSAAATAGGEFGGCCGGDAIPTKRARQPFSEYCFSPENWAKMRTTNNGLLIR